MFLKFPKSLNKTNTYTQVISVYYSFCILNINYNTFQVNGNGRTCCSDSNHAEVFDYSILI